MSVKLNYKQLVHIKPKQRETNALPLFRKVTCSNKAGAGEFNLITRPNCPVLPEDFQFDIIKYFKVTAYSLGSIVERNFRFKPWLVSDEK